MSTVTSSPVELIASLYRSYNDRNLERWLAHFTEDALWLNVPTEERYVGAQGQWDNYFAWSTPFPRGRCEDLVVRGGGEVVVAD